MQVRSLAPRRQWVKGSGIALSCGVGCRCSSDPALLWLWCWPAAAAPIRPLAWEPPFAAGVALKPKKGKKKILLGATWICVRTNPACLSDVEHLQVKQNPKCISWEPGGLWFKSQCNYYCVLLDFLG